MWTYDSNVTFDAKDAAEGIVFTGDVEVVTNATSESTLNLKSNTEVKSTTNSKGALDITGSTMNLSDNLETLKVTDKTTLAGTTINFADRNNLKETYQSTDYRTMTSASMDVTGDNKIFMRTDATKGVNDKIVSTAAVITTGNVEITVFEQGMRNGFGNGQDENAITGITLVEGAGTNITYTANEIAYDNGVWNYTYDGEVNKDNSGNLTLDKIITKAAEKSTAQYAAEDANKTAAGAAVTLYGADETLMDRMGELRTTGVDENNGFWAKYVGGKINIDGTKGDNDFKYNGVEAGYDRAVGNNWHIGLAATYAKGDTSIHGGSGEIKSTAGALYGTWLGDKGHHVDIIAKAGKLDSEMSLYGGTMAHKMTGDFSGNAMSFAVEYGRRHSMEDGWFIEPMVRASYVHLGGDDYTVSNADTSMKVENDSMNSIVLRGGFLLGKKVNENANVYLKAAVLHDFGGDIATKVSADGRTATYEDSIGGTGFEYGIGMNIAAGKNTNFYLDLERISGGEVTKSWGANVGLRYSF